MKKLLLLGQFVLVLLSYRGHSAVYTVTSLANSGAGTYRAAVDSANLNVNMDTISFAVTGLINLGGTPVQIGYPVCVIGPGPNLLTISGFSCMELMGWSSGKSYISGLTFTNGQVTGGAIHNMVMGDTVYITDCVIKKCSVPAPGIGAGINCGSFTSTVLNNVFIDSCSAGTGAGLAAADYIYLKISNSTISNCSVNYNDGGGGAILTGSGDVYLINTTFFNNSVQDVLNQRGGAILCSSNSGTHIFSVVNCTFKNNAAFYGFNISLGTASSASINFETTNTIYDGVYVDGFEAVQNGTGTITTISHGSNICNENSMVFFLTATGDLNNTDPKISPAAVIACFRPTCALQAGSPASNAANAAYAPVTDACGTLRGSMPDIGAYEGCTATTSSQTVTACFSYVSPSGSYTWTSTGIYQDTITNQLGCDSVITTDLTVNVVGDSVTQIGIVLTANESGALYQWLDCNAAMATISGETGQTFTASVNGSYAVAVTKNGCTDTSACYSVNSVGLTWGIEENNIRIFPNPATGQLFVQTARVGSSHVEFINSFGQNVLTARLADGIMLLDVTGLPAGSYEVRITSGSGVFHKKVMIL